jgi:hypothetical protein
MLWRVEIDAGFGPVGARTGHLTSLSDSTSELLIEAPRKSVQSLNRLLFDRLSDWISQAK